MRNLIMTLKFFCIRCGLEYFFDKEQDVSLKVNSNQMIGIFCQKILFNYFEVFK